MFLVFLVLIRLLCYRMIIIKLYKSLFCLYGYVNFQQIKSKTRKIKKQRSKSKKKNSVKKFLVIFFFFINFLVIVVWESTMETNQKRGIVGLLTNYLLLLLLHYNSIQFNSNDKKDNSKLGVNAC